MEVRMFKVVVTDYTYENLDIERKILARPDIELQDYQYRDAAHVEEITADCDVLVTQYADINREVIENLAHCRMIIRYAIGVDNIDLAAASERGIPVVNVPDYGIDEVSTYAVTLLLCAARKIPQTIDMIRRAEWNYAITKPMYRTAGKTVGLIGFGRIPRAVAKKLSGFDMQILAYDPFVSEESAKELGVKLVSFEELVCQSDYISVHCPLTAQTHHIVNEDVLRAMKKTAFLINTSRGATVDTEALYHACRDGEIAGAAIDVTEQEPLPAGSPLRTLNNLIITPHIAWYTEEAIATLKEKLAQEIIRVYEGGQPVNIVNRNSLKGMETK
jgi:D-3-phosphoglycerate dehydrogenase